MAKIFVVEDQPRNMRLIEQILLDISDKIQLTKATSGFEAIEVGKENEPDLVLMDISLPDMDGIEITNELKKYSHFKSIPFIAVTAYATITEKENISRVFDYYVSKPIDEDELVRVIKDLLKDRL